MPGLPLALVLVLFGGRLSRIAVRIVIEACLGYKRLSDRCIQVAAGAAVRVAGVTTGLTYLGAR